MLPHNQIDTTAIDTDTKESRQTMAKAVMNLFSHWGLSSDDQLAMLGLDTSSRSTLSRYRHDHPLAQNRDLKERVGHLLSIHKSLRIIFPYNKEIAYGWMSLRNKQLHGMSPVEVIREYGFAGLLMVRRLLDFTRGQ